MSILDSPLEDQKSDRVWSSFQQDIFTAVKDPSINLLVQAVAGSGKTTTIVEAMQYAPGSSLFLAFNKAIALEISSRLYAGEARTLNSLGHRMWMQNLPGATLEVRKVSLILEQLIGKGTQIYKDHGYTISRLVGLAKNSALGINGLHTLTQMDFEDLCDAYQFDVPVESLSDVAQLALQAFRKSVEDLQTFDFDDQLYMPVYQGWKPSAYDNVFVDESQDLSPIQHLLLSLLDSRVVAVGDRHQAIYGFRGALADSMDRLKYQFGMIELPLSISYRCAQEIIREAQAFCPSITAREGAPLGIINHPEWGSDDPQLFKDSLIVCRNNAPLFRAILRHVRAKSPCRVLTNLLEGLQSFIRHFRAGTTTQLQEKLDRWYLKEREAAESRGSLGKIAGLEDKYETIRLLCDQYRTVEEILDVVKRLGQGTTGPTFATIHKAKGLEHDSVFILRPDLMPAKYALSPEARQQEANLTYVAITRAKRELSYGTSGEGK